MRFRLPIVLGLLAALVCSGQALAERRVALVIGNAQYVNTAPLRNPKNDAEDVAGVLKTLGFEVLVGLDLDQVNFARKIDEFARVLDRADVGLFFYAGHGMQINEKNFLVSTAAKLESEFLIPSETIELDAVIRLMESRAAINLVFLDACRNNPLAENLKRSLAAQRRAASIGRGLAKVEPTGHDTLVAFSAAPGQEAADGSGRNSPFASALVKHIPESGVEVSVMLKLVAADVREATKNAQRPQQLSDMSQTFFFAKADPAATPAPASPTTVSPAPLSPPGATNDALELAFWQSAMTTNTCESVRAYIKRFPKGTFLELAKLNERQLCTPAGANASAPAALPADAKPEVKPEPKPETKPQQAAIPRNLAPAPPPPPPVAGPRVKERPRVILQRRRIEVDAGGPPPRTLPGDRSGGSNFFQGGRKCRTVDVEGLAPRIVCD